MGVSGLRVLVVPADMSIPVTVQVIDRGLSEMQKLVATPEHPGSIEAVHTGPNVGLPVTGWVHDEGMLLKLPVNWRLAVLVGYPGPLFGNGFIDGLADADGEETSVPPAYLDRYAGPLCGHIGVSA